MGSLCRTTAVHFLDAHLRLMHPLKNITKTQFYDKELLDVSHLQVLLVFVHKTSYQTILQKGLHRGLLTHFNSNMYYSSGTFRVYHHKPLCDGATTQPAQPPSPPPPTTQAAPSPAPSSSFPIYLQQGRTLSSITAFQSDDRG